MTPYASNVIFTDGSGRPIDRPEPPKPCPYAGEVTLEEKLAFIQAVHAYNNRVTSLGSETFARAFTKALAGGIQ